MRHDTAGIQTDPCLPPAGAVTIRHRGGTSVRRHKEQENIFSENYRDGEENRSRKRETQESEERENIGGEKKER